MFQATVVSKFHAHIARLGICVGTEQGNGELNETMLIRSGAWREVRTSSLRPRGRYGHVLVTFAPDRVLLFGGETASGIVNDTWVLSGASSAASSSAPTVAAWHQLETGGAMLSARKGHAAACASYRNSAFRLVILSQDR